MAGAATSAGATGWVNGVLVDSTSTRRGAIVTDGETITHVIPDGQRLPEIERVEDVRGAFVLPAAIDVHCHFRVGDEPPKEGFSFGSQAALAGGIATALEHPQATPTVVDVETLEQKLAEGTRQSFVDFGLWVAAVPGNSRRVDEALAAGACGVKAFLCEGNPQFPPVNGQELAAAMRVAASRQRVIAVHAEWQPTLERLRRPVHGVNDWERSRPIAAEVEAVAFACRLAGESGARLHLVHLSSASAVGQALAWRRRGADVSVETCPHYLFLDASSARRLGPFAKCMPPLRRPTVRAALRKRLATDLDILASDHAPHRLEDRAYGLTRFAEAPSGLATNQFMFPCAATLLCELLGEPRGLRRLVHLSATQPAARFGIPDRGRLETGAAANFVVLARQRSHVQSVFLLNRIRYTPLEGLPLRYEVLRTVFRGETAYAVGEGVRERPTGRWLRWPR